jgi:ribonuclease HII
MVIIGIDEVGRGCWAGPVVAGAVVLDHPIAGLKDSKKLSKSQRQSLDETIRAKARAIGIGWVDAQVIDAIGLTAAVSLAMQRALDEITIPYDQIIMDGNHNFLPNNAKVTTMVKADDSVPAVSAASIVAKVARDAYMATISKTYPQYGFELHVGYGTSLHADRLKQFGVCDIHRRSFKPIGALL